MRFFLIDRIMAWQPGIAGSAVKNVALSEDLFDDHFPLKPIMPGVLMIEGMAQLSGLLLEEGVRRDSGRNVKALMSIVREAKFRKPVYPGDQLVYDATVQSVNELGGTTSVCATVNGEIAATCSLTFSFHVIENPRLEARRSQILALWLRELHATDSA